MTRAGEEALLAFVRTRMIEDADAAVGPETELFRERILDSMNVLRFIGWVEKRLGRPLTDDELVMENFRSVRTICDRFLPEEADEPGP